MVFLLSVFDTWLVLCVLSHSVEFDFMVHTNPLIVPPSICFLCFRYLLTFHAFALLISFFPLLSHLLLSASASLVGFQPLYLMLIALRALQPRLLLSMPFTLSIALKIFAFVSPAHVFMPFPCTIRYR